MTRREMLSLSALIGAGLLGKKVLGASDAASLPKKKILYFTKSSGFEHSVIKRVAGNASFSEHILSRLAAQNRLEFTFSKDGSLFTPEYLAGFDAYLFYTSGYLSDAGNDKNPPVSAAGKQALLDAISGGKGFVGLHSASDSWHTGETAGGNPTDRTKRYKNYGRESDPFIQMLGGEFIKHGEQQTAKVHVVNPKFPGCDQLGQTWALHEEWYSLKDFAPDLHVLLVQDTMDMKGPMYQRPNYPCTWARQHGKGRVFYTSLGHREDVWLNAAFQSLLMGGLHWASGAVDAEVPPNLGDVTPGFAELPPQA